MQNKPLASYSIQAVISAVSETSPLLAALAHKEGEDAHLNGMTRSLARRLLGLNVPGLQQATSIVRRAPHRVASVPLPQQDVRQQIA